MKHPLQLSFNKSLNEVLTMKSALVYFSLFSSVVVASGCAFSDADSGSVESDLKSAGGPGRCEPKGCDTGDTVFYTQRCPKNALCAPLPPCPLGATCYVKSECETNTVCQRPTAPPPAPTASFSPPPAPPIVPPCKATSCDVGDITVYTQKCPKNALCLPLPPCPTGATCYVRSACETNILCQDK
jgi:hypothetical protein